MLAEQPFLLSLMLGLIGFALIYGWMQTGKRGALIGGLFFALLVPGVWVLASLWVTDREQIEQVIYDATAAVEANDPEAAVDCISDPKAKTQALLELPRYQFSLARVNKIRSIDIVQGSYPPEADVDMSVKVDVSSKNGAIRDFRVLRRLLLRFQKDTSGQWKVVWYQHLHLTEGVDQFTTSGP